MPKTLSLLAVLKKIDTKGLKSLSDPQWNTFLASDTEPNEIQEKIKKLEGIEEKGGAYDATGELIVEDNQAMIDRFKKKTGRAKGRESLKVKKSKINVKSFKEKFLDKDEEPVKPDTTGTSTLTKFQPPAPNPDLSPPDAEEKNEETEGLKGIRDILDDILKVLRLDFKGDRKEARDAQKEAAKDKREKRERKLEGGGLKKTLGGIGATLKGIEPIGNAWDAIINFLKFTLIGVLFNKTMKWFSDPKNQKKAKRIGKFFKDWWPALATAAALFLTPLGGLIKGVVGLLTAIIPKIVMAIAANPWAALALVGTGLAVWGVSKLASGGDKKQKSVDKEVDQGGGEDDVRTTTTSEEYTEVAGERFDPDNPTEDQQQVIQFKEMQENSRQGMNEGGLVQSSSTQSNQQSNQSSNVQNYNEGGLVKHYNDQKSAQNFVQNFNEGGLVQHLNKGGLGLGSHRIQRTEDGGVHRRSTTGGMMDGGLDKTTTSTYERTFTDIDGNVITVEERDRMREQITAIGVPDLIEHQDQLLSEIHKLKGFESVTIGQVINQQTGIPQKKLLPILLRSDAQKATSDKEDKATQEDKKARGIKPGQGYNISAYDEVGRSLAGTMGYRMGQTKPDKLIMSSTTFDSSSKQSSKTPESNSFSDLSASINASAKDDGTRNTGPLLFGNIQRGTNVSAKGFNKGGEVPGTGNTDTVPAMLTPGEFVMSKGAVNKYGVDTLENMNAAAGSVGPAGRAGPAGPAGPKGDTVPSMLTPGEFVVSAPAVQKYGVKTLESMNLRGGGNNKPEIKVGANKGGLINNYNTTLMKYKGGGVVEESVEESVEENVSRDIVEIIKKTSEHFISLVESSGFEANNISTSDKKMEPVGTPPITSTTKTITLPTIPKQGDGELIPAKSKNEIPEFRIPIVSSHRSMVIASLGIQDLVGG